MTEPTPPASPRGRARRPSARVRDDVSTAQSAPNVHPRSVDVVLFDLATLARSTGTDQRAQVRLARRRGDMRQADMHALAAQVHEHYADQLFRLAHNLHAGSVLRTQASVDDLLTHVQAPPADPTALLRDPLSDVEDQ